MACLSRLLVVTVKFRVAKAWRLRVGDGCPAGSDRASRGARLLKRAQRAQNKCDTGRTWIKRPAYELLSYQVHNGQILNECLLGKDSGARFNSPSIRVITNVMNSLSRIC